MAVAPTRLLPEPGYKARRWEPGARESYPAGLTSQGVTSAVQALFTNRLAASVFDVGDVITRGIMPLAVIVFNDNDFAVAVDGETIEWTDQGRPVCTYWPEQAALICLQKGKRNIVVPRLPSPRIPGARIDRRALDDFGQKFLGKRVMAAGGCEAGFLYFPAPAGDLRERVRRLRD